MVDPSVKFASGRHTLALEVSQTIPTGPAHPQSRQTVGLGQLGKLTAFFLTRILTVLYLLTGRAAHLRQLRCERRALRPGRQTQSGGLHCTFDQMLARLGNYSSETSWWRRLILSAEGDYVLPYNQFDPHFLRIPAIRDWLDNWYVCADLKVLATEKLLTGREENVRLVRQRLADLMPDSLRRNQL